MDVILELLKAVLFGIVCDRAGTVRERPGSVRGVWDWIAGEPVWTNREMPFRRGASLLHVGWDCGWCRPVGEALL